MTVRRKGGITITVTARPKTFLRPAEINAMLTAARADYEESGKDWKFPRKEVHNLQREGTGKRGYVVITWERTN